MESKGGGAAAPPNDSEEAPQSTGREVVISGPAGFRVVRESLPEEVESDLGPGDRIHLVIYQDSELGRSVANITVVTAETLGVLEREVCPATGDPFHVAITKMAWTQVCGRLWNGPPPEGTEPEKIHEISRAEMRRILEVEFSFRKEEASRAS